MAGGDFWIDSAQFLSSFKEYPQRQKVASFNFDDVMRGTIERAGKYSRSCRVVEREGLEPSTSAL